MSTVINPATEETLAELPGAGPEEIDDAVAAAGRAWPAWRDVSPSRRARLLRRVASIIEENGEELGLLETRSVG